MKKLDYKNWYKWFSTEMKEAVGDYFNKEPLVLKEIIHSKKLGYQICVVQIRGKQIFPELDARYILEDSNLIEFFSKKDVVKITKLALKLEAQLSNELYKVVEFAPENSADAELITVLELGKGTYRKIDVNEIDKNQSIQNKFTSSDALLIGKQKARIELLKAELEINKLKKNKFKSKPKLRIIK